MLVRGQLGYNTVVAHRTMLVYFLSVGPTLPLSRCFQREVHGLNVCNCRRMLRLTFFLWPVFKEFRNAPECVTVVECYALCVVSEGGDNDTC